jgi:RNA polymerase sigma-70 factor (ECF subfamily)
LRKAGPTEGENLRERFAHEAMEHLDHLYRVAFHLAKEPNEAQDLVQETYARALAAYRQFVLGTHLKAWLTKILYNFFSDRYREAKRWVAVEDQAGREDQPGDYWEKTPAENPGPESAVLSKELNAQIGDALKQLPEEFRLPLVLVDMGDFSYAEAAEILSCPIGTVRSRLFRGRRLLHRCLKAYVNSGEQR